MIGTHESHELIELAAALLLSSGGGAILVRAALDRRDVLDRRVGLAPADVVRIDSSAERRSAIGVLRRAATLVAVGLSAAAAVIHLAAGPDHVEALGDLGLGFYWAALFQGVFAAAWLTHPGSRRLAWIGIVTNVMLLGTWAWSRTIGLPVVPGGPEAIGVADRTAVLLQLILIGLLVVRLRGLDLRVPGILSPARLRTAATAGLVTILGVVALSTTIAVADAAGGHRDGIGGHHAAATLDHDAPQAGNGTVLTIP